MGSLIFFLAFVSFHSALVTCAPFTEFLYPNFTASFLQFVDRGGTFLLSRNETFRAAIFNPGAQQTRFYLCVIHSDSNTIIWSANRNAPVSNSGKMMLTSRGINITELDGDSKWSTPSLQSLVSALQLNEAGNLVLLDQSNATLWESYRYPTDTIVIGQVLPFGTTLYSAVSSDDLSSGDYSLALTASNAILQWQDMTYWKLSMDTGAFTNSNYAVDYMAINGTGLYLFSHKGSAIVIQVNLPPSGFRTAKLDYTGQFSIRSFSGADQKQDFVGPDDSCRIPYVCGRLGLCSNGARAYPPQCTCPSNFHVSLQNTTYCVPIDNSYSLPLSCNSTNSSINLNFSTVSYVRLGYGVDYFSNDFNMPAKYGVNLSVCQDLCSGDCACFGVFYENSSGSCYVLENEVGSIMYLNIPDSGRLGYIKTLVGPSPKNYGDNKDSNGQTLGFPVVALVLLPFTGLVILIVLGSVLWRRSRLPRMGKIKTSHSNSPSGDLEAFSIPGLPVRFEHEELEAATENFKTQIGSGGFGAVYKGMLPDKILVAVKKINNLGIQGKKDFCTEIAIIGNIHHINLVKLKGYCAQGRHRLLVYEYMNRGSLDRSLFGNGPVLEWQERVEIALGAVRGLAYLHSGCEHKIIHCDVKPENILLHNQFQAKLSDFGLSKLLTPEQSSLFTTMRGTRGYLAPEWLTNSAISDKTDVYSFGMVLLEIVSGRKNCPLRSRSHSLDDCSSSGGGSSTSSTQGLVYFPLFALEMHEQGRYLELADPRLEGRVTSEEVKKFVCVALCCVHEDPALRPNMVSVVGMLEGDLPLCEPRVESLNFLRFYGLRFAEASTIEEAGGNSDVLHLQANTPHTSTMTGSHTCFSYISSQQISGPR
ncbi:hypothetical protein ACH5RR_033964 [Cinchona calisaya]|uniref:Receptor-like serine/threonine-protein kinase n=1 Tax=Cinchona calisaya TaxID=153742 RepID=A0ABD2YEY6_9GENT